MAELDSITVFNPTEEDFVCTYNGEKYKLAAGVRKEFAQHLAIHMAKQLSDKIIGAEVAAYQVKRDKEKGEKSPFDPKVTQMCVHDNPRRRIALYDILQDKTLVERAVRAYPFKAFIGLVEEYDAYVAEKSAKSNPREEKTE